MDGALSPLLATAAIAAVQLITVDAIDAATRAGYDPLRNWISQLALEPRGWLGSANLALCGAWLLAYAIALRRFLPSPWPARLVALCGLGFGFVAVVPVDPGMDFPAGATPVHTAVGAVHQLAAVALFAAGTTAAVVIGRALGLIRPAAAVAGVMIASFVTASILVTLDVRGIMPGGPSGLFERIAMFTGLGWLGVTGLILQRRH